VAEFRSAASIPRAAASQVAGMIAALEGRGQDAVAAFRSGIDLSRSVGADFNAAVMTVDAAKLMPGNAQAIQWVPFARSVFERVGARPYLELLDEAVGTRRETAPRTPIQVEEATTSTV
jgi:hypothetical protein